MKNTKFRIFLVILIMVLSTVTLSCNMLSLFSSSSKKSTGIEEQLTESGMVILRDVVSTKDIIAVSIEMAASDSLTDQYVTWVYIYDKVLESAPDVKIVVLNLYFLEESYLSVTAQAEDITALVNGEIDQITFIDRLNFDDQRLPDLVLRQELENLGWIVTSVLITEESVDIEAFPPDADTYSDIIEDWTEALMLAADQAPEAQQISLHLLLIDTPNMAITVDMADLAAYQNGEMDEITFLANWVLGE